jgi:long-chain acyl-CoA synthetase
VESCSATESDGQASAYIPQVTTLPHQPTMLSDLPTRRARTHPEAPCIEDQDRRLDNVTFAADVDALVSRLSGLGVVVGDVVAVMLPSSCEIVTSMFAAWRLGAALTPVNPALTDAEVTYQLEDCSARVVIGDERSRRLAAALEVEYVDAATIHAGGRAVEELTPVTAEPGSRSASTPDDFAFVVYTSGTTGRPKGCLLDHTNVAAMVDSISTELGLDMGDTSLLVLPLFHCNGLIVGVLSVLQAGGSVVVGPRFDPDTFWQAVERHRPTFFSAVPTMYALLESKTQRQVDTSSLRFVVCGAAPMSAELISRFESTFSVPIVEGYGLSEGTVASTLNPVHGPRKAGTVGRALPGQKVEIEAPDGQRLPPGERGEVVIRGDNVMRGYLGRPDETAAVLKDGWLHTGDVGYLDPDGYLVLVDRMKDMIIRGGENIFPKEIEIVLYKHRDVLEAAVVGRPDPIYGEVPVAYVAPRPGSHLDSADLLEHCRASLARFKLPQEIHIQPSLPKNAVGKLMKGQLKS